MSVGLALGKFAPLHKGHQLVLDSATEHTDSQIFVIYDSPSSTTIPLPIRAKWVQELYPQAEILLAWGGPEEVGLGTDLKLAHEAFLKKVLAGRTVTHFFKSEDYGSHIASSLNAVDVQVDPARSAVPISATKLRSRPDLAAEYLHPRVLRDLITKIVFLGAPSTGKSTIAAAAAKEFGTVFMPEYGREFWERFSVQRRLTMSQLEEVAQEHIKREDALLKQCKSFLFIDTDASTTEVFASYYHGYASPLLEQLSRESSTRYDLTFLCMNDFPYADTEDRSGLVNQLDFQRRIVEQLRSQKRPYLELRGSVSDRLVKICQVLSQHSPFSNPANWGV
jgi:NadR type nicotinamide-nucleotide adenylyltransferase